MRQKLQLPQDKVNDKKSQLLSAIKALNRRESDQLYAETIRQINEPAGQMAALVLDDCTRLRRRLNLYIWVARIIMTLALIAIIISIIIWSYFPLIAALALFIIWYFTGSRMQTYINIELGAMTEVFCEMIATEAEFRSSAIEVVRNKHGAEYAESFASFLSMYEDE